MLVVLSPVLHSRGVYGVTLFPFNLYRRPAVPRNGQLAAANPSVCHVMVLPSILFAIFAGEPAIRKHGQYYSSKLHFLHARKRGGLPCSSPLLTPHVYLKEKSHIFVLGRMKVNNRSTDMNDLYRSTLILLLCASP